MNGGTLNNNGGTVQVSGTAILNGTLPGGFTLNGNYTGGTGTTTELNGTITNNGTFTITGGSGTNAFLALAGNTTLNGGTVTLAYTGSGNGVGVIEQAVGGTTLTNNALIQGGGVIGNGGIALNNTALGTINANVSGQTLILNGSGGTTNQGLLEATNGGTLELDSQVIANTGANITAGSGSTVTLNSTTLNGGTLNANGGTAQVNGFALLNGALPGNFTLNGTLTAGTGTTTELNGTIINNGTLAITGGSGTNAFLGLTGDTTLQGGTVSLGYTGSGAGVGVIEQVVGGTTLTNKGLIQGGGVVRKRRPGGHQTHPAAPSMPTSPARRSR